MKYKQTSIIPIHQKFYNKQTNELTNWKVKTTNSIDLEAIASFCSLGFMLDDQTFFKEIKTKINKK